jgi:hypothetical protein
MYGLNLTKNTNQDEKGTFNSHGVPGGPSKPLIKRIGICAVLRVSKVDRLNAVSKEQKRVTRWRLPQKKREKANYTSAERQQSGKAT